MSTLDDELAALDSELGIDDELAALDAALAEDAPSYRKNVRAQRAALARDMGVDVPERVGNYALGEAKAAFGKSGRMAPIVGNLLSLPAQLPVPGAELLGVDEGRRGTTRLGDISDTASGLYRYFAGEDFPSEESVTMAEDSQAESRKRMTPFEAVPASIYHGVRSAGEGVAAAMEQSTNTDRLLGLAVDPEFVPEGEHPHEAYRALMGEHPDLPPLKGDEDARALRDLILASPSAKARLLEIRKAGQSKNAEDKPVVKGVKELVKGAVGESARFAGGVLSGNPAEVGVNAGAALDWAPPVLGKLSGLRRAALSARASDEAEDLVSGLRHTAPARSADTLRAIEGMDEAAPPPLARHFGDAAPPARPVPAAMSLDDELAALKRRMEAEAPPREPTAAPAPAPAPPSVADEVSTISDLRSKLTKEDLDSLHPPFESDIPMTPAARAYSEALAKQFSAHAPKGTPQLLEEAAEIMRNSDGELSVADSPRAKAAAKAAAERPVVKRPDWEPDTGAEARAMRAMVKRAESGVKPPSPLQPRRLPDARRVGVPRTPDEIDVKPVAWKTGKAPRGPIPGTEPPSRAVVGGAVDAELNVVDEAVVPPPREPVRPPPPPREPPDLPDDWDTLEPDVYATAPNLEGVTSVPEMLKRAKDAGGRHAAIASTIGDPRILARSGISAKELREILTSTSGQLPHRGKLVTAMIETAREDMLSTFFARNSLGDADLPEGQVGKRVFVGTKRAPGEGFLANRGVQTLRYRKDLDLVRIPDDPRLPVNARGRWVNPRDLSRIDQVLGGRNTAWLKFESTIKKNLIVRNVWKQGDAIFDDSLVQVMDGGRPQDLAHAAAAINGRGDDLDKILAPEFIKRFTLGDYISEDVIGFGTPTAARDAMLRASETGDMGWLREAINPKLVSETRRMKRAADAARLNGEIPTGPAPAGLVDKTWHRAFDPYDATMLRSWMLRDYSHRYAFFRRQVMRDLKLDRARVKLDATQSRSLAAHLDEAGLYDRATSIASERGFDYANLPQWAMMARNFHVMPFAGFSTASSRFFYDWIARNPPLFLALSRLAGAARSQEDKVDFDRGVAYDEAGRGSFVAIPRTQVGFDANRIAPTDMIGLAGSGGIERLPGMMPRVIAAFTVLTEGAYPDGRPAVDSRLGGPERLARQIAIAANLIGVVPGDLNTLYLELLGGRDKAPGSGTGLDTAGGLETRADAGRVGLKLNPVPAPQPQASDVGEQRQLLKRRRSAPFNRTAAD